MVRHLHLVMDDATFEYLRNVKKKTGLTWEKFLVEAAKALEAKIDTEAQRKDL